MGEKKGKNTVFYVSLIIVGIIAVWSVAFNDSFTVVANAAFKVLTTDFGWLYLISMIIFFGFIVSKLRKKCKKFCASCITFISGLPKPSSPRRA